MGNSRPSVLEFFTVRGGSEVMECKSTNFRVLQARMNDVGVRILAYVAMFYKHRSRTERLRGASGAMPGTRT